MVYHTAKTNSDCELTEVSALLHDIGKPFIKQFDPDKMKTYFYGHEYASALLSVNFLKEHFPNDIQFILNAIVMHTFGFKGENLHEYFEDHDLINFLKYLNTYDNHGRIADEIGEDEFSFVKPIETGTYSKTGKEFIMLIGIPGSGKSTWSKDKDQTLVFSPDKKLTQIAKDIYGADENDYRACWEVMKDSGVNWTNKAIEGALHALSDNDEVIYDATNMSRKKRAHIVSMARQQGANVHFKLFWRDLSDCLNLGNREGNKYISEGVYKSMIRSFSYPKLSEYDTLEHIII